MSHVSADPAQFPKSSSHRRCFTTAEADAILSEIHTFHLDMIAKKHDITRRILGDFLRRRGVNMGALREQREARARGGRKSVKAKTAEDEFRIPGHAKPILGYGIAAMATKPDHGCSWPLGDPELAGFAFCGLPRATGSSYCERHHSVAWRGRGSALAE